MPIEPVLRPELLNFSSRDMRPRYTSMYLNVVQEKLERTMEIASYLHPKSIEFHVFLAISLTNRSNVLDMFQIVEKEC